jgi:nitrogen fixation/metabolism regulation signal transduction histidine kinase
LSWPSWTHERRIFWLAVAAGLPGSAAACVLLWSGDYGARLQWTLTLLIVALWWGLAFAVRERTVTPLQTLANLLEALREGDYSIRARQPSGDDVLGEVLHEVNELGEVLRSQRFDAVDAETLLTKVIAEIDVAVFTFGADRTLRLVNRAGERMMARRADRLLGRSAAELGLDDCLDGEASRTFERSFPGQSGRWQCRRSTFREGGLPHHLLVLTDLSKALREEERQAWQRLIRVLGHELNNSLAPIKSTASTVVSVLRRDRPHAGWREDAERGLRMIAERCESLNRFVAAYSRLARLPSPRLRPTPVSPLVRRVVGLEGRMRVAVHEGPELVVPADADQLEQLLINLIKNAVEATAETDGGVAVSWRRAGDRLELSVVDEGPGLPSSQNLFVPFFTTKPGGTGIGLVLGRQIAEAHGGTLELASRSDRRGAVATLRLPL